MLFETLTLRVAGLCLFVPEPAQPPYTKVHMLLPRAGHGPRGTQSPPIERHYARLFYRTTHGPSNDSGCRSPNAEYHCISLEGKVLDLSAVSGAGEIAELPDDIIDLSPVVERKIRRELIGSQPSKFKDVIAARITVAAGSGRSLDPKGPWCFGNQNPDTMAWRVEWTIPVTGTEQLDWELGGLNGSKGRRLEPLRPGSGGAIELQVANAIAREAVPDPKIPKPPPRRTKATHFAAYYDLFENPAATPIPEYDGEDGEGSAGILGLPYTCMVARASL